MLTTGTDADDGYRCRRRRLTVYGFRTGLWDGRCHGPDHVVAGALLYIVE